MTQTSNPHAGLPVLHTGALPRDARAVVILVHGRGASAESILTLAPHLEQPDVAYLAPQAHDDVWYPKPFMAPLDANEPWLTGALATLQRAVDMAGGAGRPPEQVALLGFSQGACLSLEFVARNPRRYGAVIALSGGLIGPDAKEWRHEGTLAGTPVFLGCSDIDPHIPLRRVQDSSAALRALGADVTERIYPGMGHTLNDDELMFARSLLAAVR